MIAETVLSELDHEPFRPLRLHLVSGKVADLTRPDVAHPLRHELLILRQGQRERRYYEGYDLVSYRDIERIEVLDAPPVAGA